jgi:hypothetical protein
MDNVSHKWNTEADGIARIDRCRFWARIFQAPAHPWLATEVPARNAFRKSNPPSKTSVVVQLSRSPFLFCFFFANP